MDIDTISLRINSMWPHLNERQRRLYAASEAAALGHGGIATISGICGLSRVTITKGMRELNQEPLEAGRIRNPGSGRPPLLSADPGIMDDLTYILDDSTRCDPESLLRWTCKSSREITEELGRKGHKISCFTVRRLLRELGYSLQSDGKAEEGKQHSDRDAQFRFINELCQQALKAGQPVLSVHTKKKESVGDYKNEGKRLRKKGDPLKVTAGDFPDPNMSKAMPHGIYDIGRNTGCVNLSTDLDTSTFAVNSIRGWWTREGGKYRKDLQYVVITADGGGSNGSGTDLWKVNMQGLANYLGVPIHISHFPPSTSKWNKVEHRLFSFFASNRKGEPSRNHETIVNLISHASSRNDLNVKCGLDRRRYKAGIKATPEQSASLNLERNKFHGEWNYILHNKNM
jgi:transposase